MTAETPSTPAFTPIQPLPEHLLRCDDCNRLHLRDTLPEPGQHIQCEDCWRRLGPAQSDHDHNPTFNAY